MTTSNTSNIFEGAPSEANNHIEHTTTDEMPVYVANATLKDHEENVKGWRTSIYKFYFPLIANTGETRNPYQCVRHMLAILGKQCKNQFRVLPKNAKDDKNKQIAIWTDFPASKEAQRIFLTLIIPSKILELAQERWTLSWNYEYQTFTQQVG